jgi:hypothetical protein
LLGRHRLADQVTLGLLAAVLRQPVEAGLRLDTLGNHLQTEVVRQPDRRTHDRHIIAVDWQVGDEGAVYLEFIHRQALDQ